MLCPASAPLRTAALSLRFQPSLLSPSCAYSTSTTSKTPPPGILSCSKNRYYTDVHHHTRQSIRRPSTPPTQKRSIIFPATTKRHASTITASQPTQPPASSASSSTPPPTDSEAALTWNEFLALRHGRRRYNIIASISTSLAATAAGITILSQTDIDSISSHLYGLDPFMVLGLATLSFSCAGWLCGPVLGGWVFGMVKGPGVRRAMRIKEKEFFQRIKRHRVDPSSQSFSNPVPDYYGEKIGSVRDYRRWLRDQRAFNRKRERFL